MLLNANIIQLDWFAHTWWMLFDAMRLSLHLYKNWNQSVHFFFILFRPSLKLNNKSEGVYCRSFQMSMEQAFNSLLQSIWQPGIFRMGESMQSLLAPPMIQSGSFLIMQIWCSNICRHEPNQREIKARSVYQEAFSRAWFCVDNTLKRPNTQRITQSHLGHVGHEYKCTAGSFITYDARREVSFE